MIKRIFDIILSTFLLLIFLPLILIICILTLFSIGSPIFFTQNRPGLLGKSFEMIKFRTMLNLFDEKGVLVDDEYRLTKFGKFLRSTSIDEIPELWNVLKGEMSIVGPRPLLVEYLPLYSKTQSQRHNVKPGITGWAQINGRNSIDWSTKFGLDIWYVENQTIWLDIKILFITVKKVLKSEGISTKGKATMTKFTGEKE
ncbi:sugar transferase [Candidatus Thioglobus sp.]|nr:sugar transferase [Candidatus Thioglobus sp.]